MRWARAATEIPITHTRGDVSFCTNMPEVAEELRKWCWVGDRHTAPDGGRTAGDAAIEEASAAGNGGGGVRVKLEEG